MKYVTMLLLLAVYSINAAAITCAQVKKARDAHKVIYIKYPDGTLELVKRCVR